MQFVDAHVHLSDPEYSRSTNQIMKEATDAGVIALISNSVNLETSKRSLDLSVQFRQRVFAAVGIHPLNVQNLPEDELQEVVALVENQPRERSLVAIGEIGLDSEYMSVWNSQLEVFGRMLRVAEKTGLPVVIHSRGATEQVLTMLPSYRVSRVLLHWFSNPISALPTVIDRGYYVSEGPPALYSKGIQDVIRKTPLQNLLTETDGPVHYFKEPFSERQTTPAFIPLVVKSISEIKELSMSEVADQIARNFQSFSCVRF